MKLLKSTRLWWSGPVCTGLVVSALVALVLMFGPDWLPTPAPPPDLQKEMVKVMRGGVVHAQGRDNVYQLALNAVTVATNSGILRNNGQNQHFIWANVVNSGGVCAWTNTTISLGMQGSYDNTNWFSMGSGQTLITNGSGVGVASGAFPFLRASLALTYANCAITVWYTGSITPNPDLLASWSYFPLRVSGTGPVTGAFFATGFANRSIAVYGFNAYLVSGAGPVLVTVYSATSCMGAPRPFLYGFTLATATPSFVLPNSTVPYFLGQPNEALCFDLGAGGAVVGLNATLRWE